MGLLSDEVKYRREWLGLSLKEFAQELGKPMEFVRQMEDGERRMTEAYFIGITAVFGYIPLSEEFKNSFPDKMVSFKEPPTTARRRYVPLA